MKKTIGFVAIFIICCLTSVASAETIFINPPEMTSPEVGQTLTLDVMIEGAEEVFAFAFDLSYNPEFLEFVSGTEGGYIIEVWLDVFGEEFGDGGVGTIGMSGNGEGSGNGVLAQMKFEVIKKVSMPIPLEFQWFNLYDAQYISRTPAKVVGSKIIPRRAIKTILGDVNGDGRVDISDLVLVGRHFGEIIAGPISLNPDVNEDGTVDISDLVLVSSRFSHRPPLPTEIAVVETGDPEAPILVVHEDGSHLAVLSDTDEGAKRAIYTSPEGQKFFVWMDSNGIPYQAHIDGYTIVFANYTATTVDIAIISPDGTTRGYREVSLGEFSLEQLQTFNAPSLKKFARQTANEDGGSVSKTLSTIGLGLSIAGCVAASVGTGGIALLPCGAAMASVLNKLTEEDNPVSEKSLDLYGAISSSIGCVAGSPLACVSWAVGVATSVATVIETLVEDQEDEVTSARKVLESRKPLKDGEVLTNSQPFSPEFPSPDDGEEDVEPDLLTLTWVGDDPDGDWLYYDVYFGQTPSPPLVSSHQEIAEHSPINISVNTTYYWQVAVADEFGLTTFSPVWSFTTRAAQPPEPAFDPNPPDGATDQPAELTLSWSASHPDELSMTFDVHLGTDASNLPRVQENLTKTEYKVSKLEINKTHYWQVITKDGQGNSVPGPIWSFSTISNQPPDPPFNPSPSDGATNVNSVMFTWSASDPDGDALTYNVYFSTYQMPAWYVVIQPRISNLEVPKFIPIDKMEPNTTYFWRVAVKDNAANATVGNEWSFTTGNQPMTGLPTAVDLYAYDRAFLSGKCGGMFHLVNMIFTRNRESVHFGKCVEDDILEGDIQFFESVGIGGGRVSHSVIQEIEWENNYSFTMKMEEEIGSMQRQLEFTGTFSEDFRTLMSLSATHLRTDYGRQKILFEAFWKIVLGDVPTDWDYNSRDKELTAFNLKGEEILPYIKSVEYNSHYIPEGMASSTETLESYHVNEKSYIRLVFKKL